MPVAIDEIRKLAHAGHDVFACDTFRGSPGSHCRGLKGAHVTASPRHRPSAFVADIARIVEERRIDLLMPAFEDAIFLARYRDALANVERFYPTFDVITRLHHKSSVLDIAREAGVAVPRSILVTSTDDLVAAAREMGMYVAKPVYSRGGLSISTNVGPLANALSPTSCRPTPSLPWVVQEFIEGEDVCSFSIVHHGRVTGHASYVHPREIEHSGGIVFESIDEPRTVEAAERIADLTRYHGQLSFDFRRSPRGLFLIECNPRPTAGVHLMSTEMFDEAIRDRVGSKLRVVPASERRMYGIALVRDAVLHPREAVESLRHLFSDAREVVFDVRDPVPALEQLLSYGRVLTYRRKRAGVARKNTALMAAYFDDVCWDGEAIEPDVAVAA